MKRVILIDIGTHKAQEVRLLKDSSFLFRIEIMYKLFKSNKRSISKTIDDYSNIILMKEKLKNIEFVFCFVEPVFYFKTAKFLRQAGNFVYLNGVCSALPSGAVKLLLAKDNLGNSIIESKPNLTGKHLDTWNYNFQELLDWCNANLRQSDDDLLVLRMNAEGVEKDIVEYLHHAGVVRHRVRALYGSLGDIRKCFGEEAAQKSISLLAETGIPYVYFTSSPKSWRGALKEFCDLCGVA